MLGVKLCASGATGAKAVRLGVVGVAAGAGAGAGASARARGADVDAGARGRAGAGAGAGARGAGAGAGSGVGSNTVVPCRSLFRGATFGVTSSERSPPLCLTWP